MTQQSLFAPAPRPRFVYDRAVVSALGKLAHAARSNGDTHEAGAHVSRAAEMVKRDRIGEALFYLRTLARNALSHARLLAARGPQNGTITSARRDRARVYLVALRLVRPLGATAWMRRPSVRTRSVEPLTVHEGATGAGATLASYGHDVTNPSWPTLGAGVGCRVMRHLGKLYMVELECEFTDQERSHFATRTRTDSLDEAMALARDYIDLGETLLAATLTSGGRA